MPMTSDLAYAGLIHDLNNVFATIQDVADVVQTDPNWEALALVLQRNVLLARRILGSFVESGGAFTGLDGVLQSAMEFAGDFLQAEGSQIEFRCHSEPGLRVRGSRVAWERVVFNLLINAGQAMGTGAVEILARQSADHVEITVTDAGPGILEQDLARIFEPGFSTKPARSGLGLHIVASIVNQNGGSISASHAGGKSGAVFRILAPSDSEAALDGEPRP
jgi:signal transduction histidine kinase